MTDVPAARVVVALAPPVPGAPAGERLNVGEIIPKERTPRQMLEVLRRIVNRKVEELDVITHGGAVNLGPEWDGELDAAIDRVCKLARADREIEPTDEELLSEHDKRSNG